MKSASVTAILILSTLAACGGSDSGGGGQDMPTYDSLSTPETGFQMTMPEFTVPSGRDSEFCYTTRLPGDGDFFVNRFESAYTEGSHHFLLRVATRDIPDWEEGRLVQCGQGVDELGGGMTDFFLPFGAQKPYNEMTFPEGVGFKLKGGTPAILNMHYINSEEDDRVGGLKVNVHTAPEGSITQEAGLYFWFNPFIYMEAGAKFDTYLECGLPGGTSIINMSTHMHRTGVRFDYFNKRGGALGDHLHHESNWEHPVARRFDPPYQVTEGETFRFECGFDNFTDAPVMVGQASTDEMCLGSGYYFPKVDRMSELCITGLQARLASADYPPQLAGLAEVLVGGIGRR